MHRGVVTLLPPCSDHHLPARPRETQLSGADCGNKPRFQPVWVCREGMERSWARLVISELLHPPALSRRPLRSHESHADRDKTKWIYSMHTP